MCDFDKNEEVYRKMIFKQQDTLSRWGALDITGNLYLKKKKSSSVNGKKKHLITTKTT